MNRFKLLLSISLLSASIIAFQLALIQIISIVQWYHFAYMIISMALLGFGAAGTVLSLFRPWLTKNTESLLPVLMIVSGMTMSLVTDVSQMQFIRFDSYLLFADYGHIGRLVFSYFLFFIPFFLSALAIGLSFVKYVDDIGKIYFANLLGSGVGAILALVLIWIFFPNSLPALIAILAVLSGVMLIPRNKVIIHLVLLFFAAAVIAWKFIDPPHLHLSEYKDLSKTFLLPGAKIVHEETSPYGVVQMLTSPALRYAPGMSLTAQKTAQVKMAAFVNGDWYGVVTDWKKSDTSMILDYTTAALPYRMAKRNSILVLQSGTGIDVAHGVTKGVNTVVAVESNPVILSLLRNRYATEIDSLFSNPGVSIHNLEPRTFMSIDTARFDLIVLPVVGTFGGSSGLYALHEQFLLTKESFLEMWHKLHPGGVISITSWMDYPIRNPLKILATIVEVLKTAGVNNTSNHIAAIRSWGTISFVMTKSPLTATEINNIHGFCEEMMFDPTILPGLDPSERNRYNQLQDNHFFSYIDRILSPGKESFYSDYDFNIKPATDNKPYFSQYIKWSSLNRMADFYGNRSLPFFEVGYLLVILTLVQISIASFILIILPLFKLGWKGQGKRSIVLYFSGIGIGYMFVEMVFIQRFILYFGNPVYSAATIITFLLIFSGIGSYHSMHFSATRRRLRTVLISIVCLLFIYSFILTPILQHTVHLHLLLKLFIVFLLTAPLAFFMGIPFPAGISNVSKQQHGMVPWAWGINGCASVISTALATIIAVEIGFTWVVLFGAIAYCLPLVVVGNKWQKLSG
jgi:hypothetical protein